MGKRLTQATIDRMPSDRHPVGTTVSDGEVPGLRVAVGKKSSTYRLVARVAGVKPITVTIARTDEISLAAARDRARELRLEMRQGIDPRLSASEMPTVAEAGRSLIERKSDRLTPRTVAWYRDHLATTLKPLADARVDGITPAMADRLHVKITKKSGPYHANGALRVLRAVLNFAARTHDLPPNPVSRGVTFNKERAKDCALDRKDLQHFWRCVADADCPIRRAAWTTLALTGLRVSEVLALRWEDIDDDDIATIVSPKGGPDRSFRTPLPSRIVELLRNVEFDNASDLCFPALGINGECLGRSIKLRRTDRMPFHPHQMRHTFRTIALEAGVDFQSVQLLMNHKLPGVSGNYVSRDNLMAHLREQVDRIATLLTEPA